MGIPKFYRWLSERYPLISAPIEPDFIPDFDNIYLDMNGIVHNCTHPEWNDNYLNRLSEKEMTFAIFQYIDKLVQTVKPRKLIYMAIDGCAPRAKMNQQRQRRFKSAQEAKEALAIAKEKGQKVPDEEELFDSNCITPGTEFMARLSESIKYFVRAKIRDDATWRNVKVIFSGHEVPGEGEHKIMEYIRHQKNQPDFELNQKHCLYGLDADLIMLSLVSHEPNFALLREEVIFGRKNKRAPDTPPTFQLLYINILREYLDQEFRMELPFGYDFERVIDDFILMCFFVGNDFLPELPYMDIAEGALDKMFEIYREVLPTLGGYLTTSGEMNLDRCEKFIARLAKHEQEMLAMMPALHLEVLEHNVLKSSEEYYEEESEEDEDDDHFGEDTKGVGVSKKNEEEENKKQQQTAPTTTATSTSTTSPTTTSADGEGKEVDEVAAALAELEGDETICFGGVGQAKPAEPKSPPKAGEGESSSPQQHKNEAVEEESEDDEDDGVWKNWYYRDKFRVGLENEEFHKNLRKSYLEGLAWVLKYYYYGCVSWAWFYPYHYAPLATDLTCLKDCEFKFELGTPFHPFEQLMGVLPPHSKRLLPRPFQELMTNVTSPIHDYYPLEFKVDMNGKRNPWEGIALIPFIDQDRLIAALHSVPQEKFTDDELRRNSFGKAHLFRYDPEIKDAYPSPMPSFFDDLAPCCTSCEEWVDKVCETGYKPPTLLSGTKLGLEAPPGFPTLESLSYTSHLAYVGLSLFGMNSRKQSLVLKLAPRKPANAGQPAEKEKEEEKEPEKLDAEDKKQTENENEPKQQQLKEKPKEKEGEIVTAPEVAQEVLGKTVYVSWPYLREAIVLGVSDAKCRVSQQQGIVTHTPEDAGVWQKEMKYQLGKYKTKKAIDLGPLHVMLHVQVLKCMKVSRDGARMKVFAPGHEIVPYQIVVLNHHAPQPNLQECPPPLPDKTFPLGGQVIYLGPGPAYGALATVLAHVSRNVPHKKPKIKIEVELPPPLPTFGSRIAAQMQEKYFHLSEVSRKLNISPKVLSKVTGSVYTQFETRKINIGLRIKFTRKMQQVLGYTQRIETQPATDSSYGRGYWVLSAKAFDLVRMYKEAFPDLFASMERVDAQEVEVFTPEMLFPNGNHAERIHEVDAWLRALETSNLPRVPCGSKALSVEAIKVIEDEATKYAASLVNRKVKKITILANASSLISPLMEVPAQDIMGTPQLGERVMNIKGSGHIPFAHQGTVVGIIDGLLEVVFDKPFIGGIDLGHRCSEARAQKHIPYWSVLSLSGPTATKMRNVNHHQAAAGRGSGYKHPSQQAAKGVPQPRHSAPRGQPSMPLQQAQQPPQQPPKGGVSPPTYVKKSKASATTTATTSATTPSTTTTTSTTDPLAPQSSATPTSGAAVPQQNKQHRKGGRGVAGGEGVVYRPKQSSKNGVAGKSSNTAGGEVQYVQKKPATSNGGETASPTTTSATTSTTPDANSSSSGESYDPIAFWNSLQQPQGQQPQQPQQPQQQQHSQQQGGHGKKRGGPKGGQQQGLQQPQQQSQQPPSFLPFPLPGQPLPYYATAPPPYGPGGMPLFAPQQVGPRGYGASAYPGGITIPPELYQGGILPTPQLNWQQQALLGLVQPNPTATTTSTTTSLSDAQGGNNMSGGRKSGGRGRGRRPNNQPPQQGQQQPSQQWKQRGKQGDSQTQQGNNTQGQHQQQYHHSDGRRTNPKRQHRPPQQQQQQQPDQQDQSTSQPKDAKDQLTWQQKLLLK